jgi:hypothetical protein
MYRMSLAFLLLSSSAGLCPTQASAAPVTYLYDSGAFTSSPRAQTPLFGTHFTAELTFSDDLIPSTLGVDYLNRVSEVGNSAGPFVLYQHATLLDWTVTSGSFTLNASNASFTSDVYTYTSAGTGFVPQMFFSFEAVANDIVPGGSFPVSITARPDLNITQGIGPYPGSTFSLRNSNLGGGTLSKVVPAGNGSGTGGTGAVPEPSSWALMLGGFGVIGGAMRTRRKTVVSFG